MIKIPPCDLPMVPLVPMVPLAAESVQGFLVTIGTNGTNSTIGRFADVTIGRTPNVAICPLFKKGDRSLARNYRPVSLTCIPCKLFEHIVCSNIMAHLDEHELLSDRQHAFRKWHSCETQLTTVINDWAKILDKKGQVDTFILDFEKAFDTPPHELLKSKLFSYGIGGTTLNWINAFLCFRQQRVVVNGIKSDWAPVVSGVPQGTVLGPLLFSLYINDISADIESEIRLFADDCVCYREIKNEEDTFRETLIV